MRLSLRAGLAQRARDGALQPAEIILKGPPLSNAYVAEDACLPADSYPGYQRWPRTRVDRVFQRGIKRTLAIDHYESRGYFGVRPVEVYSTSPWHALAARQILHAIPRPGPGPEPLQAIRIYHEPFGKFSQHCPRSSLPEIFLLDPREKRALIVGSFAGANLSRALKALAWEATSPAPNERSPKSMLIARI
ncbi:MAG: hypothetical protein EOP11_04390 [Proteobacteria bacterium]|nr:MAG: hypothetical protein EOP11_04390 [Pseudomonadota bacterium]